MKSRVASEPFSYRSDSTVPAFDDGHPVTVMDGHCVLCTAGARLIARMDRRGEFRICRAQSALGRSLLEHYGLRADDPLSWLYIADGRAHTSLDAMIRAAARLGGAGHLLWPLRLLPRAFQDMLYRALARNRYRLFGRTDMCAVPDAALRSRLLE
jgi:predicted DCC family thiol-disulfide oxidoreductase YuxK